MRGSLGCEGYEAANTTDRRVADDGARRRRPARPTAAAVEACLVAAASGIAATTTTTTTTTTGGDAGPGVPRYLLIVLLGLALGTQNAAARKLAVPDLTTTVLTLTITGIFADGRLAGGAASRVGRRLLSMLAMFLGGLAGALLVLRANAELGLAVAAIILVLVAVISAVRSRTDQPWIHAGKVP
jgi:hypothetical protein